MNKLLLVLALIMLLMGLALSIGSNMVVCMWGCPQTVMVYSLKASFFILIGLIVWVGYKLYKSMRKVR